LFYEQQEFGALADVLQDSFVLGNLGLALNRLLAKFLEFFLVTLEF
jgi:hypothetical protein